MPERSCQEVLGKSAKDNRDYKIIDCQLGLFGGLPKEAFDENVCRRIQEESSEGTIACSKLLKMGQKLDLAVIRGSLDASGVKVIKCALGCF